MARLQDRVQHAVEEGRILYLGANILIGFEFRSTLERGFEALPHELQYLKLGALALLLVVLALLMWISAYHRIVEQGNDTERLHRFITRTMSAALLPFALAFGADLFLAGERVAGRTAGLVLGGSAAATALFFWYGLELLRRRKRAAECPRIWRAAADRARPLEEDAALDGSIDAPDRMEPKQTPIVDKIEHLLEEIRVVLPGAQALLGFQLAAVFVEGFERLPPWSKYVHLGSMAAVALSVVLLMAPAAYHRIVERGEDTEHFHRVASAFILAAMVPLALGVSGDFFVVVRKVTGSIGVALVAALAALTLFYGLWFGYTAYRRARIAGRATRPEAPAPQTVSVGR